VKRIVQWGIFAIAVFSCPTFATAQQESSSSAIVPPLIRFGGVLQETTGKPLTGVVGVTFSLFTDEQGGAPLWMETQNVRPDEGGHYTVMLGGTSSNGLPADIFASGEARWLAVQVAGQAEQARILLVAVPYAMKAADADTIRGLPPSAFVLAIPPANAGTDSVSNTGDGNVGSALTSVTGAGTLNFLPIWTGAATLGNSVFFQTGGRVGIGTTTPGATLDVKGGTTVRGQLLLPAMGTATATAGFTSQGEQLVASAFNSTSKAAVNENFRWVAEPAANNTTVPSATLNLQFSTGVNTPAETGLKIASNGRITFASGQTFPGNGTVKSVGLSAASSDFKVSGSPVTSSGTLALAWNVAPTSASMANAIVKRDASNAFSAGNITVGNISAGFVQGVAGVEGDATSGNGVFGQSTGGGHGVFGLVPPDITTTGQGVVGESFATQSSGALGPDGVDGIAHSDAGSGVMGMTGAAGNGVFGLSSNSGGQGLDGFNSAAGDGILAGVSDTTNGFAGFFVGPVDIDGTLTKPSGSFKIDHPLDPANKYLYHSFVESPDMMNIYNGNLVTDAAGTAVVHLPDWFESLNRDFRYQLTVIGQFAQAIVIREIDNGQFTIQTDKPNVKVSWQVTGIRQDAWANAHRIPVEVLKSGRERGFYLHPELFGAPEEKSVAWLRHPQAMKQWKETRTTFGATSKTEAPRKP
jgi:hypothetical protein